MKIKSVQISGMHNVEARTYDFNDIAYLFGKNGAGKSTVMQAIQLAILGYIPGTDKTNTAIFRHANCDMMSVSVEFDNGQKVTRLFKKSGNSVKVTVLPDNFRPEHILGELELPVFNFNEFASMTANKLKDWFIGFLPDDETTVDWTKELQCDKLVLPDDQDILDSAFNTINSCNGNGLDTVRSFNEYCKTQVSNLKFEIARLEGTMKSLVFYDDFDSSLSLDDVQEQIRVKEIELDTAKGQQTVYYANLRNLEEAEAIRQETGFADAVAMGARLDELGATYKDLHIMEEDLQKGIQETEQAINEVRTKYNSNKAIIESNGICPYTSTLCESIKSYVTGVIEENARLYDKQNELLNALSRKRSTYSEVTTQISNITKEKDHLGECLVKYSALKRTVSEVADINTIEMQIVERFDELKALRETERKIIDNQKYEELKGKVSGDLFKAQHSLEVYKAWEKMSGVNALQSKIMVLPFQRFSEKISVYLRQFFAADISAEFYIGEKANSFSFGINNGRYIEYDLLSSGEKCLFALSLLLAIVENSNAPAKLLLVDDILDHLDPERIKDCFSTLYNSTIQTVIAGVQKCEHEHADEFVINI